MSTLGMLKDTFLPKGKTYYVLQPGKGYWVKDTATEITIEGMENELKQEKKVLKLKKLNMTVIAQTPILVKTLFGMKELSFAYMPDKNTINPVQMEFDDGEYHIVPNQLDLDYIWGTLRTYQDIRFKEISFWDKFLTPIAFLIAMIGLTIFLAKGMTGLETIVDKLGIVANQISDAASTISSAQHPIPEIP